MLASYTGIEVPESHIRPSQFQQGCRSFNEDLDNGCVTSKSVVDEWIKSASDFNTGDSEWLQWLKGYESERKYNAENK